MRRRAASAARQSQATVADILLAKAAQARRPEPLQLHGRSGAVLQSLRRRAAMLHSATSHAALSHKLSSLTRLAT